MSYLKAAKRYTKVYKNWLSVLVNIVMGQKNIRVMLRDGRSLIVSQPEAHAISIIFQKEFESVFEDIDLSTNTLVLRYGGRRLHIYGFIYGDLACALTEYKSLNTELRRVETRRV